MNLIDVANFRYSTKAFDPSQKIPTEIFEQIQSILRLSPSSVNSQPWHFIIASTESAKQLLAKGTEGFFSFNQDKMLHASHVILFCAKTDISDDYLEHVLAQEELDGRFAAEEFKQTVKMGREMFVNIHRFELKDAQHWMEKQLYLNMGAVLLGAGALGVDAVPMEGIDTKALDEVFDLHAKGYTAVAAVALGYRSEEDFNAKLPKSRLPEEELFTILK